MKREILKPGMLFPPADLRRDEFDADNERLLMAEEALDIVFIGDSITEGWDVRQAFADLGKAVNRGISGDVIDIIEKRFAADVLQLKPKVAVINGGVNNTFPFFETAAEALPPAIEEVVSTFVRSYCSASAVQKGCFGGKRESAAAGPVFRNRTLPRKNQWAGRTGLSEGGKLGGCPGCRMRGVQL